jgi:hypothetical protein
MMDDDIQPTTKVQADAFEKGYFHAFKGQPYSCPYGGGTKSKVALKYHYDRGFHHAEYFVAQTIAGGDSSDTWGLFEVDDQHPIGGGRLIGLFKCVSVALKCRSIDVDDNEPWLEHDSFEFKTYTRKGRSCNYLIEPIEFIYPYK